MYSLVIPIYKNEGSIPDLISVLQKLNSDLDNQLEVVFVIDGSPDKCYALLAEALPKLNLKSQLITLSRNFGSFAAVRVGLENATGSYFAIMAADLQEPPELVLNFFRSLSANSADVIIGTRSGRQDPFFSRLAAHIFWRFYQKFVVPEMPTGGIDMFACNLKFRTQLLQLEESHSSLIGLIFWLGFKREQVSYERKARKYGKSSWTFRKKFRYMMDSIFAFSDLPIKMLMLLGGIGFSLSIVLGIVVFIGKMLHYFNVPGYASTVLTVLALGSINILGLGLVGSYAWRAYENTKARPLAVVMSKESF